MTSAEPIVVGLGELLWDCFGETRRPGGAPANVAFHAQQHGNQGIVCSRVGQDDLGQELIDVLAGKRLSTESIQRDTQHPTGTVTVDTTEADHPDYIIHENVAWDFLQFDDSVRQLMQRAAAVCFGTLAQRMPQSRQTIQQALDCVRPDCLVVYDVNLRQKWYAREWIEASLKRATIVKLNRDEVRVLSQLLFDRELTSRQFAACVQESYGVQLVCVTLAEDGCELFEQAISVRVPGVKVDVIDAVGAGDAFTATLISARLRGWPLDLSARFANEVGALVAGQPGAMPDLADRYAELVDRLQAG